MASLAQRQSTGLVNQGLRVYFSQGAEGIFFLCSSSQLIGCCKGCFSTGVYTCSSMASLAQRQSTGLVNQGSRVQFSQGQKFPSKGFFLSFLSADSLLRKLF